MSHIDKSEGGAETILSALSVHSRTYGDKIIYTFLDSDDVCQTITYNDLEESARCIARELLQYSLPGDRALLTYTSSVKANSKVLSVACGHFREIGLTSVSKECRFFLLDQDRESLSTAVIDHGSQFDITPINMSIEEYVNGKPLYGKFDLIYSAGLFDYLDQEQACRIVDVLFDQLLPSGRVIIANFSDTMKDAAFMELFMDWWLEYRNQTQICDLARLIAKDHIAKICVDSDEAGNIRYLTVVRCREP